MLTHFLIDGEKHPVEDVLSGKVSTRFPMSYLKLAADFRKWDGKPHVTDLFNGARILWLKNNTDYAVDPDDAAYRVIGVSSHSNLEAHVSEEDDAEVRLENEVLQGTADLVTYIHGEEAIVDFKVVGSYKIQQALGLYYEDVPQFLPDGKPEVFKTGARAGQQKTKKELRSDPSKVDVKDFTRQLNIYRYLYKKTTCKDIKKLYIFAIARDGGTISARQRGVTQKTYTFEIKVAGDDFVQKYIETRTKILVEAMASKTAPVICQPDECWQGRRCQGYCEVADACKAIGDNPYLGAANEEDEA